MKNLTEKFDFRYHLDESSVEAISRFDLRLESFSYCRSLGPDHPKPRCYIDINGREKLVDCDVPSCGEFWGNRR